MWAGWSKQIESDTEAVAQLVCITITQEIHLSFSPPPILQPASFLSSTIKSLTPYEDMVHTWCVIRSSKEQHSPASLTFPMVQSRWKLSHCLFLMNWSLSYSRIWRNLHLYDNSFHQQWWLRERDTLIASDSALMRASLKLCSPVKNWVTWSILVLWNLDLVSGQQRYKWTDVLSAFFLWFFNVDHFLSLFWIC